MSLENAREAERAMIISNGAGTVKTLADIKRMCRSAATRITVGSITMQERAGNEPAGSFGTYYWDPNTGESGNALGLPNMGLARFLAAAPEMLELAHAAGKRLVASVAGFSPGEIADLTAASLKAGLDGIEINLSCPNVKDGGEHHALFASDPEILDEALWAVKRAIPQNRHRGQQPLGAKVSTITDSKILLRLSNALFRTGIIDEIVAVNTDPDHEFILRDSTQALCYRPPGSDKILHVGGQGGTPLKEKRREVVRSWRKLLPHLRIIALGGILCGQDVHEAMDEDGADGFACATAYLENGPGIFSRILQEYADMADVPAEAL